MHGPLPYIYPMFTQVGLPCCRGHFVVESHAGDQTTEAPEGTAQLPRREKGRRCRRCRLEAMLSSMLLAMVEKTPHGIEPDGYHTHATPSSPSSNCGIPLILRSSSLCSTHSDW